MSVTLLYLVGTVRRHYNDVIMSIIASRVTGISIVCSTVCSCADQRKHHSSNSMAFARRIQRWAVDSPHKWPLTRKIVPFDDVIITRGQCISIYGAMDLVQYSTVCRWTVWLFFQIRVSHIFGAKLSTSILTCEWQDCTEGYFMEIQ